MKGMLIGPDNQRFEAEIVRYFQNINDKYLIYTKGEKDSNGFILLYATKVISDNGIRIGENIIDANEWSLVTNFLKKTVGENKENKRLTINDINPIEVNDLKINASRPFKLDELSAELFGRNKKSFEIVQQMLDRQNTAIPVAPEVSEFVTNKPEEQHKKVSFDNLFKQVVKKEEPNREMPVREETPSPVNINYEGMYNKELERNNQLNKEIEQLIKDNAELKAKMDKLKELLG